MTSRTKQISKRARTHLDKLDEPLRGEVEKLLATASKKPRRSRRGRYAAKLLFQFNVLRNARPTRRRKRLCEERIVVLEARSAKEAYRMAGRKGKSSQHSYTVEGADVRFEFVGVLDLVDLLASDPDEVWWDLVVRISPMERRAKIVPKMTETSAIRPIPKKKPGRLTVP